jgi:UDP-glucose 4-epimerase
MSDAMANSGVLITGAAGFIGSALLRAAGAPVATGR